MIDLLVTAGTVITVDRERRVLTDAAVAIDGGRIVEVGDRAEMSGRHEARETIDAPGGILLPGLVDAHGHAGHSLVRTLGGDDLDAWLEACGQIYLHGSGPGFWSADARLTALERLMFGTTTGLSMMGGAGDTIRCDDPAHALAHVEGTAEVGIRDVLVIGPGAPPFPKVTTDGNGGRVETDFAGQMAVVREVLEAESEKTRIALTFPTLSADAAGGDELAAAARAVAELVAERGLGMVQDGHMGDTVVGTDRLGLLGPGSLLSHSVDLEPEHVALLAERGAAVAHNPSAVFSQFGRCPVPELLDAGVPVALGSDATGPDRSADMFRHMFQATRYHRATRQDPALLPPGKVLEMATVDAAAALGFDDLGSIEPGKRADVIVVDAERPHLTPLMHPVHQIVYYATGSDVATVVVGGEILMRDRRVETVDVPEVLAAARREHGAVVDRLQLGHLLEDRPGLWGGSRYPAQ